MGVDFYQFLYQDLGGCVPFVVRGGFPPLNTDEIYKIGCDVFDEEIKVALFSVGGWKAPGPYGLPAMFF